MSKKNVLIAGAGGIGQASAIILANYKDLDCNIYIGDRYMDAAVSISNQINTSLSSEVCFPFHIDEHETSEQFFLFLKNADVILDCLPGSEAPKLAQYAKDYKCHYANLTEYVKETDQVTEIAKNADTGFILQTGLAPGYINILALHLFNKFTQEYKVDSVDTIEMKVGALSKHAESPYFYAYTWSPIGVATEYVKNALVVENYKTVSIPSLSKTETILIDGIRYEDDYTSGGAADLPTALAGKTKNLRYKTIRYPGHFDWVKSMLEKAPSESEKISFLNETMMSKIPAVEDDVVVVYASVKGTGHRGIYRAIEKSLHIYPSKVGEFTLRAIQSATAAPLCEAALMLLKGEHKGAIFQSQINTKQFLNGPIVSSIFGKINI